MSRILIKTQETYRVELQTEVEQLLEDAQNDSSFELKGHSATKKTTKNDEYFVVTLKKQYNDEKTPV